MGLEQFPIIAAHIVIADHLLLIHLFPFCRLEYGISPRSVHIIVIAAASDQIPCMALAVQGSSCHISAEHSQPFQQILGSLGISRAYGMAVDKYAVYVLIVCCLKVIIHRVYNIFVDI